MVVDVATDGEGRIAALGQEVRACALGQASAALMGAHAIGRTAAELAEARDALAAYLAGTRDDPGDWPGLAVFAEARRFTARHASILLAFEAAAEAALQARARRCRMRARRRCTLLDDAVILLGFALVFVLLFRRLGLGATLGYLVAGALVGPHLLGLVGGGEAMLEIAEIGIVLLLFLVGLELNPARLWRMRHDIFGFGLLQVLICGVADLGARLAGDRFLDARPRSRSACRWRCPRPRRCCRCCNRPGACARRSASALSRSCSSRTFRSCR